MGVRTYWLVGLTRLFQVDNPLTHEVVPPGLEGYLKGGDRRKGALTIIYYDLAIKAFWNFFLQEVGADDYNAVTFRIDGANRLAIQKHFNQSLSRPHRMLNNAKVNGHSHLLFLGP